MAALLQRLRRDDGQGLIELIVALTILAIGIGAVLTVLTGSALSLQRSDQKGTALTLAETQLELYRNLAYPEIRLDDASWSSAPLTNAADPYFTASSSDPTIPSGAKAGEVIDTGTDIDTGAANTSCVASPPECQAVRTVTGPDHRRYRIDTYITTVTPTDNGNPPPGGTVVGKNVRQVTVVVRNAELASLPILARNTSTFSKVNAAAFGGKAVPNLTFSVPRAWVTSTAPTGTTIPASAIGVNVSNGLYPLTAGSTSGVLTIYVIAGASSPSPPCGGAGWTQVGQATVNNGNVTYYSNGAATVAAGNTYWWYATFTGDASNQARTSRCSPSMTTTKVQANPWTPSISVSAPSTATTGISVAGSTFTATLSNSSPGATGTIHLKYVAAGSGPSPCPAGTELGTAPATGDGNYSQANAFPATTAGTYWWWATYDGDSNNNSATSVCGAAMPSTVVAAGPSLVSMSMKDTNGNGKVDQVVATFDKPLGACTAPCTTGWTLSNVPSAGTLSSVTTSGSTATLTLTEGGGAENTAVGTFTIAMDSSSGIVDTSNRHGSFTAAAPADGAAPVITGIQSLQSSGAAGNGKMEAGDKFALTFSEAVTSVPAAPAVTETRPNGSGNVTLTIAGLTSSASTGSTGYLSAKNTSAGYPGTTLMSAGNTVATITLGAVKVGTGTPTASSGMLKFVPVTPGGTVQDSIGNKLSAEYDTVAAFKLF